MADPRGRAPLPSLSEARDGAGRSHFSILPDVLVGFQRLDPTKTSGTTPREYWTWVEVCSKPRREYVAIAGSLSDSTYRMIRRTPREARWASPAAVTALPSPRPWAAGSTATT